MATIFQGERIANVLTVQDDSTGNLTPTNFYQVPAGRWAVVKMLSVGFGASKAGFNLEVGVLTFSSMYSGTVNPATTDYFNATGTQLGLSPTNEGSVVFGPMVVELTTGQLVRDNAASGVTGIAVNFTVKEYFNP